MDIIGPQYHYEVSYSMIEINDIITDSGFHVEIKRDPDAATTMTGFDDTYVITLLDRYNNEVGICTLVIENFSISINDDVDTNRAIFIDYTTINDQYQGLGLSKIFILFQVLLSIQLEYVSIVSHDTAATQDGIYRYGNYLFNEINGEIWYNDTDNSKMDGYDSDNEIDSEIINNILLPQNVNNSKIILIDKINQMIYQAKYLKYKKKYMDLKSLSN